MAQREAGLMPGMSNQEEMEFLRKEVRDVENRLVETVQAIREKVSYEALKNRALSEVRGVAVEKPKQFARSAAINGYDMMKKAQVAVRQQPIILLVVGIAIMAPLFVARLKRRKK